MIYTVYDAAHSYLNKIKSALAINARTMILHNEDNFMYEKRGGATLVRSADAGGAGTYNKATGFTKGYGGGAGLTWEPYIPQNDRAKVIRVDKADELASYLAGMDSSIGAMAENYGESYLAPEFDAANIASLFAKAKPSQVLESGSDGADITVTGVLATLNNLDMKMFNAGSSGPAVFFIEASVYAHIMSALLATPGALPLVSIVREVRVETGFEEVLQMEAPVTVATEVMKWGKHYICPMPTNRMNSDIVMLDGQGEGQEEGGWVVAPGSRQIRILAVPLAAGFASVRYEVTNLLLPGDMRGFSISESEVTRGMEKLRTGDERGMFSNMTIQNVAFNPYFDSFEIQSRVIYGADLFNSRARACFAVADAAS